MKLVKNSTKKTKVANSNYNSSKYNATKYGVFSKNAVMPWENKDDYDNILKDLIEEYQPNNVTERHLIVEMANTIWAKIRLKYAEKASLQSKLNSNVNCDSTFSGNKCANDVLLLKEGKIEDSEVKSALITSKSITVLELKKFKEYLDCCNKSVNILTETNNYEQGLSILHIEDKDKWSNTWVDDNDDDTYSAIPEDLLQWVEDLQYRYETKIFELENRDKIKDQVLGSTFLPEKTLDKYIRYENHLDKKFEKTLAMFFKLREIRSNGGLTKSVL